MLDIDLPDIDGFTVLDRLKRDPSTRHIPVHVMSSLRERERALRQGAISYLNKPVEPRARWTRNSAASRSSWCGGKRSLLVVEDDEVQRDSIVALIGDADLRHRRGRHRPGGAGGAASARASTAWCST